MGKTDNTRRVTEYLTEDNYQYLELQKNNNGLSYSETVNNALNAIRDKKVQQTAKELVKPTEDKLAEILLNQRYIIQALNAIYRTSNYGVNLINSGIPIVRINGYDVLKPNKSIKDVARKKALRDYQKLTSNDLFREDFLEDYEDSYSAGGGPNQSDGIAPSGYGRGPKDKDYNGDWGKPAKGIIFN